VTCAGLARFVDPHQIVVKDGRGQERAFGADRIIIAVGSTPFHPKSIPFEADNVYDSDYVASEPRVPRSLTVVGAGVIGIEYATIYSALDVPVTIVEPRRNFLEFIDREIIEEFVHDLRTRGIQFRLGARVESVEIDAQGWTVSLLPMGGGFGPRCCSTAPVEPGRRPGSTLRRADSRPTIAAVSPSIR